MHSLPARGGSLDGFPDLLRNRSRNQSFDHVPCNNPSHPHLASAMPSGARLELGMILACMCVKAPNAFVVCHRVGPFRVHFVSSLGPFWVHFGSILGPFWVHSGSILGPFWDHLGSS